MKLTVTLSEEEIKNIILQHLKREGMTPTSEVDFDINYGSRLIGYGTMESRETYCNFKGAKIEVETKPQEQFIPGEQ